MPRLLSTVNHLTLNRKASTMTREQIMALKIHTCAIRRGMGPEDMVEQTDMVVVAEQLGEDPREKDKEEFMMQEHTIH